MPPDVETPPEIVPDEDAPRLMLDLAGYEGPLDLMLDLARRDKLDIGAISILDLANQYLAFIEAAKALRLAVAGDYLVMAAWLAFLKSRLLLPRAADDPAPEGEDLAADLAMRLEKLAAMRRASALLEERLALHGEAYPRGLREATTPVNTPKWQVGLPELLTAYAECRITRDAPHYQVVARKTLSIPQARALLSRMVGESAQWLPLSLLLSMLAPGEADPRSALASGFVATLELAREGRIGLQQVAPFAPLYMKSSAERGEGTP